MKYIRHENICDPQTRSTNTRSAIANIRVRDD